MITRVDPFELAAKLGVDISGGRVNGAAATNGQAAGPDTPEPIDLDAYPSVRDALNDPILKGDGSVDCSETTYHVEAVCMEAGLSLAQTRWVVDQRPDLAARLAGRNDDDVLTNWEKLQARNGWAMGLGAAAAGAPPGAGVPPGAAAAGAAMPPGPGRFFGRQGLRALDLANEVMANVTCGFGYPDHRFYVYADGVWTPDDGQIEAEITRLLGNRYRTTHTKTVTNLIRHSPNITRVTDEPVAGFINVPNGMVAWETGDLLPHDPIHRSTIQLPVEYVPSATCPRFEEFIAEVLPADLIQPTADGPGFIWELIGYTLYSGNPLHVAILLHGKGRNGKGTLIRVLKNLLGLRNCSTVGLHQLVENRFRAASLFGKLANLAGDLDSKWLDNTATFKAITGGDTIQAEYKYGDPFDFTPWALPFYSINKAFGSADSSEGWVARWVVVPFPNSFLGKEDRGLDARLSSESELRGILRRGIEALPSLMARGRFAELQSLTDAKAAFVVASDAIRAWVDEFCELDYTAWEPRTAVYSAYIRHASQYGAKPLGQREFYNRIEQIDGIYATGRKGTRGFTGVRLVPMTAQQTWGT